jgi:uncharacterized protein YegP (UPF0339 family)
MYFEIDFDRVHQYCWRLRNDDGEVVVSGDGYVRKQDCLDTVNSIKSGAATDEIIDLMDSPPPDE